MRCGDRPPPRPQPQPAPAPSDGRHHQSTSKARPHRPTPKPMGRRKRGIGPGRAALRQAAARSLRSGTTRRENRGTTGGRRVRGAALPTAYLPFTVTPRFRMSSSRERSAILSRGPTIRRSERDPDMTSYYFRSSPRLQKEDVPAPRPARMRDAEGGRGERPTTPSGARADHLHTVPGTSPPGSAGGRGYAAQKGKKTGQRSQGKGRLACVLWGGVGSCSP